MLDVTWLPAPPSDGSVSMNRYWAALRAAALRRTDQVEIECPLGSPPRLIGTATSRWKRAFFRYVRYPALARRQVSDGIVHVLDHSNAHLLHSLPKGVRTIVTVHDLIPLRDAGVLSDHQVRRFRRHVMELKRADLLLAVSAHTASELQALLGIDRERIVVAPNGVDEKHFCGQLVTDPGIEAHIKGQIILSIGSTTPRKNLRILPGTLRTLRQQGHEVCLVRVGDPLPDDLRGALERVLGTDKIVELGKVPDEQLAAVYQQATVLFFPSTHEGFGLPILEAMSAGLAVACSRSTSLPEVGGDAAVYFDADCAVSAAAALSRVLADSNLREQLQSRGKQRVKQFTWDRHFETVVSCYESLSKNPAGAVFEAPDKIAVAGIVG